MGFEVVQGFNNDSEVVLKRDAQGIPDMYIPCFAENGDAGCFCSNQGLQVGVLVNRLVEIPGGAESGELGMLQRLILHDP